MTDSSTHVLVVDDNPATRYSTTRVLGTANWKISEAASGREALAKVRDGVDLVVLDVKLPDIDGFEVCRRIRQQEQTRWIPILHLSATFVKDVHKVQGLDAGADGYLTHPVEPPVLIATANALLRARRAELAVKESELRFRAIFENALNGVAVLDVASAFVDVNPAMCLLLGHLRKELVGRPLFDFVPTERQCEANTVLSQLEYAVAWRGVFPLTTHRGDLVQLDWHISAHSSPGLRLAIVSDITERLLHEQERESLLDSERAARGEAEHANRLKDTFLAALRENEQRLRELNASLDERVHEQTHALRDREQRLRALAAQLTQAEQQERKRVAALLHDEVQQFLVAAKMRVGTVQSTVDEGNRSQLQTVSNLLDDALNTTRDMVAELVPPLLYARGLGPALQWLAQRMQQQHDLLVHVKTDPTIEPGEGLSELLFQVARELLLNVVKHAGTDCAWMDLAQLGSQINLTVRDLGSGFHPGNRDGTSFGLFHLRERTEQVGGDIEISSNPAEGTRVTITVPVDRRSTPAETTTVISASSKGDSGKPRRLRVLLVDDHEIVRSGVAGLLAAAPDVEVVGEAADGIAAIDQARELQPDAIIMDINMPRMGGAEATRRIKSEMPRIRIIAFSMHNQTDMGQAMEAAGADGYIAKGASTPEILNAIRGSQV